MQRARLLSLALLLPLLAVAVAPAAAAPKLPEPQAGLISAGPPATDGSYELALVLKLPTGWHTYWRNPGDVGLPPRFDWSESSNVAEVTVDFPAPERLFDGQSTSIVYFGDVVLPLRVRPADAGEAVALRLGMDFGYCKEVCVPGHASMAADLAPDAPRDLKATEAIRKARLKVPVPADGLGDDALAKRGLPAIVGFDRDGAANGKPAYRIEIRPHRAGAAVDLFTEGPEGWALPVPDVISASDNAVVFRLVIDGEPPDARISGATIGLTAISDDRAIEVKRRLD